MSEAEYYYIDKGVRRPLKLLSDTVALRLKDGAWEQFDRFVERKLASTTTGGITVCLLSPNTNFLKLEGELRKNGSSLDVFPVFIEPSSGNIVLLTDQITARFSPEYSKEAILKLLTENNLSIVRKSRFAPNQYILKITNPIDFQVLNVANALNESELVIFATPNFLSQFSRRTAQCHP